MSNPEFLQISGFWSKYSKTRKLFLYLDKSTFLFLYLFSSISDTKSFSNNSLYVKLKTWWFFSRAIELIKICGKKEKRNFEPALFKFSLIIFFIDLWNLAFIFFLISSGLYFLLCVNLLGILFLFSIWDILNLLHIFPWRQPKSRD